MYMEIKDICKIKIQPLRMWFSLCFYESVKVHLYEQREHPYECSLCYSYFDSDGKLLSYTMLVARFLR